MARSWHVLIIPALALGVLVHQMVFALRVASADVAYFNIEREVVFWGDGDHRPTTEQVSGVQAALYSAIAQRPHYADYLSMQARLFAWQGLLATTPAAANEQFNQALAVMHGALEVRPGNPYNWAQYAEYLTTQPARRQELVMAVDKVRQLGPGDVDLQKRMQALLR